MSGTLAQENWLHLTAQRRTADLRQTGYQKATHHPDTGYATRRRSALTMGASGCARRCCMQFVAFHRRLVRTRPRGAGVPFESGPGRSTPSIGAVFHSKELEEHHYE